MESWIRTGVTHTEPCGCRFEQRVEPGVVCYHEGWLHIVKCAKHKS